MTQEWTVWHSVNLSLPSIRLSPPRLSAVRQKTPDELRLQALQVLRVDRRWQRTHLTPNTIHIDLKRNDVLEVVLLSGGKWILTLHGDRTLRLQKAETVTPVAIISISDKPSFAGMKVYHTAGFGTLALVHSRTRRYAPSLGRARIVIDGSRPAKSWLYTRWTSARRLLPIG